MPYPSLYTEELGREICERISEGNTLSETCRELGIPRRSVHDWRAKHEYFALAYDVAKDAGYDAIADRLRSTARGRGEDAGGDSSGDVQRDKLIIDTDLKLLSKWDPRRYGDKQQIEHQGKVTVTHEEFLERLE